MTELEYRLKRLAETRPTSNYSMPPKSYDVEDADTIDGARILGFDAPESVDLDRPGGKAEKIETLYGVDRDLQYKLGKEATARAEELIQNPEYQNFQFSGKLDVFGRPLTENTALKETLISEGLATPTDRYDAKAQRLYRSKLEKQMRLTGTNEELQALSGIRDYNMQYDKDTKGGWINSASRSVDAFQSSTVQTIGSLGDLASDIVGYGAEKAGLENVATYLDKWGETLASSEYADKLTGYDRRESDFVKAEALSKLKQGDYVGAFTQGWSIAPELVAESLPIMIELMVGIGGKAKAVDGIRKNLPGVVNALKRNAGYATVVGQETNAQAEEYEQKFGEKVSASKLAEMTVMNTVMYGLDRMTFKQLLSAKDGLKDMVDGIPVEGFKKQIATGAIGVASGMGKEAGQEYLQTWGEIINVNGKDPLAWKEVLQDENNQYDAALGGLLGGIAGANIKVASEIGQVGLDKVKEQQKESTADQLSEESGTELYTEQSIERLSELPDMNAKDIDTEISTIETRLQEDIDPEERAVLEEDIKAFYSAKSNLEANEPVGKEDEQVDKYQDIDVDTRLEELDVEYEKESTTLERKTEIAKEIGELRTELQMQEEAKKKSVDDTLNARRKEMLDRGEDPVEVEAKIEAIRKKILAAGIGQTLDSKKSNIGIELGIRSSEVKGKKGKTLQAADTTDEVLNKIAEGRFTDEDLAVIVKDSTDTNLVERVRGYLREGSKVQKELAKAFTTVKEKLSKGVGQTELESIVDNPEQATPERALRILSILEKNVAKSIKSEKDIQANEGIDIDGEYTRESNIIVQLGKEYVNSYGLTISGSAKDIADVYASIGQKIIDFGVSQDAISITPRKIIATSMVNEEGKFDKDLPGYEKGVTPKGQEKYFIKDANTIELADKKGDRSFAMKNLTELFTPKNYEPVKTEPTTEVIVDRKLMDTHKGIIQKLQELEFQVKPEAMDILKGMLAKSKKYKSMDEYFRLDPTVKEILGVENSMSHLVKESEGGKNLNRVDQLRKVLNSLDKLEGKFFYSYESAINQRIHVLETIMEFQGDKYMARQMISGNEYTADGTAKDLLIENVAEEFGYKNEDRTVNEDPVRNPQGKVLEVLKIMDKPGYKMTAADAVAIDKKLGIGSPFKAINLMQAQYDIWKAGDGPVKTRYMVEFDMTASGLVNTMLNLVGNAEAQKVVKALMEGMDPYLYLNAFINGDKELETKYGIKIPTDNVVLTDLRTNLQKLGEAGFSLRDLAKYPIMTWFYGSPNANRLMGNDIAIDMVMKAMKQYDVGALQQINEVLAQNTKEGKPTEYVMDMAKKGQKNIRDINRKDVEILTKHYTETVGTPYVEQMDAAFPGVTEYRKTMGGIFEVLDRIPQWNGTIRTAMGNLLDEMKSGEYKMDVRKEKPMAHEIDGGKVVPINTKFNNKNSFMVNLQHSADAAQLLLAVGELMNRHPELKSGLMTVHDAVYGDPNLMLELKDIYEQMLEQTATKYDFLDVAMKELEEAINEMPDNVRGEPSASKAARIEEMNRIKAEIKDTQATKKSFIEENLGNMNFFGTKKYRTERKAIESEKIVVAKKKSKKVMEKKATDAVYEAIKNIQEDDMMEVREAIINLPVSKAMENIKEKILAAIDEGVYTEPVYNENSDGFWSGADKKVTVLMDKKDLLDGGKAVTPDALVKMLGHEVDHAIHMRYLIDNPNSAEVRYLMKAVRTITDGWQKIADPKVKERLKYIARPLTGTQLKEAMKGTGATADITMQTYKVAELIAIMRNEPNVAEYVAKNVYKSPLAKVWAMIDRILENIRKWVSSKKPEEIRDTLKGEETFYKTMTAMELVQQQSLATDIAVSRDIAPARMKDVKAQMYRKDGKIKTKYKRMAERAGINIEEC